MRFVNVWLAIAVCLLSLISCARKETALYERVIPNYDKSQYQIDPASGENALFYLLKQDDIRLAEFEKAYDHNDLEAVLRASAFSTVTYLDRLGVLTYRVPRPKSKSAPVFFLTLSYPPESLDDIWSDSSTKPSEGVLVGLYFDACSRFYVECRADQVVRPVILVDESGDRWTLVHEMIHHLFNVQRKARRQPGTTELNMQLNESWDKFVRANVDFKHRSTHESLNEAADALIDFNEKTVKYQIDRKLEEVATEYLLIKEYSEGRFLNVPHHAALSAVSYIEASRSDSLKMIGSATRHLEILKSNAAEKGWTDIEQKVEQTLNAQDEFKAKIEDLVRDARARVDSRGPKKRIDHYITRSRRGMNQAHPNHPARLPCSQENHDETEKWVKVLNESLTHSSH